jgi:predicted transcriptional regulator
MNKRLFAQSIVLGLIITVSFVIYAVPQEGKKSPLISGVVLEIENPLFAEKDTIESGPGKQLNFFLKAAAVLDEKNRERPFNLMGNQVKAKIARWLTAASEIESDDCHKKYLHELSENIRQRGYFAVDLPPWSSLEQNPIEIIFPRADRYSAAIRVLQTFFNIPVGVHSWGKGHFIDAFVYVNNLDETLKYKEYSNSFQLIQNHLYALPVISRARQEISYSPVVPTFKIAQLVTESLPEIKGVTQVYPEIDGENYFKIVVFKNLTDAYFEGILKPISACVLSREQVWSLDPDIYLSNLIMRRIAHHLGPVFVIVPKGQGHGGVSEKQPLQQDRNEKKEMELKTIPEILGDLFPVVEAIKSQAAALYSTPALIGNGLLPDDKAVTVYYTYLVTLIDRLRNIPPELNSPQQPGRKNWEDLLGDPDNENYLADLIQFNFLLGKESIVLNISDRTLDIDRLKFETAIGDLAGEMIRMMTYPNYEATRWFIDKNSAFPPQLGEILKSVAGIPSRVEFRLQKPKVKETEELEENKQ